MEPFEQVRQVLLGDPDSSIPDPQLDTGLPVLAGPAEATAIGNILVQALGLGQVSSLEQIREVVRRSFPLDRYEPQDVGGWNEACSHFQSVVQGEGGD